MNAAVQASKCDIAIRESKEKFDALAGGHLNYGDEEIFAMQLLTKNDYVFKIANENPRSVQLAMVNVASTGLTLNPAMGYAYLVPRDGGIVLDISFKGLIKIATDAGSVRWVRAECVHANDKFTYKGTAAMPEIHADVFGNRGDIIGAYCIAKTVDGDTLTEVMSLAEIHAIRAKSTAWVKGANGRKGPWDDFFSEMCRKAVIKRARKTWPYTDADGRLAKAIEIADAAEGGYTFDDRVDAALAPPTVDKEAERKAVHDAALAEHSESVAHIKDRLDAEDYAAAASEWRMIPQADQMALWLAPSKGGCFTTAQRDAMNKKLPRPEPQEQNDDN